MNNVKSLILRTFSLCRTEKAGDTLTVNKIYRFFFIETVGCFVRILCFGIVYETAKTVSRIVNLALNIPCLVLSFYTLTYNVKLAKFTKINTAQKMEYI